MTISPHAGSQGLAAHQPADPPGRSSIWRCHEPTRLEERGSCSAPYRRSSAFSGFCKVPTWSMSARSSASPNCQPLEGGSIGWMVAGALFSVVGLLAVVTWTPPTPPMRAALQCVIVEGILLRKLLSL